MSNRFLLFILLSFSTIHTSAQGWQWAKPLGSDCPPFHPYISSTLCDGENCFEIGEYSGCLYLPNDTLQSN